jgi:hypothetical protein
MAYYVTVADITTYVSTATRAAPWTAASDADKAEALRQAHNAVEALSFIGQIYDEDQDFNWPRKLLTRRGWQYLDWDDDAGEAIVPQIVKDAVCEEALARVTIWASERYQMVEDGVRSFEIPNQREVLNPRAFRPMFGLFSSIALSMLHMRMARTTRLGR